MGERGPIPARSEERRRTNEPETPILRTTPEDMARMPFPIELSPRPPEPDEISEKWHPLAQQLWDALCVSPEAMWMTSAGWAIARVECEQLSRELKPQVVSTTEGRWEIVPDVDDPSRNVERFVPPGVVKEYVPMKGSALSAHHRIWASLGLLEGDRRRMGREVTLHQATEAMHQAAGNVVSITRDRAALLTPRAEEA